MGCLRSDAGVVQTGLWGVLDRYYREIEKSYGESGEFTETTELSRVFLQFPPSPMTLNVSLTPPTFSRVVLQVPPSPIARNYS